MPHTLDYYRAGATVRVNDRMQRTTYRLAHSAGTHIDPRMRAAIAPACMLRMGVMEGCYVRDCRAELPAEWYAAARLSTLAHGDTSCNYFAIKSRLTLQEWQQRGWIHAPDPRGWFQWWYRYWLGRRIAVLDELQIRRWVAIRRHRAQVDINCTHPKRAGRCTVPQHCRPRQRQALLQWAHDPL